MSYHLTNTLPEKSRISSRSQLAKTDPPSKNRVWKFSTQTYSRTWPNHQETPETTSETSVTITITVSGLPFWPSRDPIEEEGGINLYGFVQNNPIVLVDLYGLAWSKVNCHALSINASYSAYAIVGGTVALSLKGEMCDCCSDSGEFKKKGYLSGEATAGGDLGIGVGTEVKLLGYRFGILFKGPNIPIQTQANVTKECDGTVSGGIGHDWGASFGGSIGGGGGIGAGLSAAATATASYGIGIDSSSVHFYFTAKGNYQGVVQINLGLVEYSKRFGIRDTTWVDAKKPILSF